MTAAEELAKTIHAALAQNPMSIGEHSASIKQLGEQCNEWFPRAQARLRDHRRTLTANAAMQRKS